MLWWAIGSCYLDHELKPNLSPKNMKPFLRVPTPALRCFVCSLALAFAVALPANAQLVINEFDADDTGFDDREFVELYDGGAGNTSLDGMVLVFYNGTTSATARGALLVFDLDGLSTDANGYFLAANSGVPTIGDRVGASTGLIFSDNSLQNGEDGVALYSGLDPTDFDLESEPRTLHSDLILGAGQELLDAVVYETGSDNGFGLLLDLGLIGDVLDEDLNDTKDTSSWGRVPDGGNPLDLSLNFWSLLDPPTPGFPNQPTGELEMAISPGSVAENAGAGAVKVTVRRDSNSGPLEVTFTGNDPTELAFPDMVTIPDGDFELMFDVDVLDDGAADGTQTVTISANAPDFVGVDASIDVTDDGDPASLVVNEIYGEVEPGQDPNFDGVTNFVEDEFVEIVNVSGGPLDIGGWELSDADFVRHVFPVGSVLPPDCAAVVFGGGGFTDGVRADFGNSLVQKASTGSLGLNDTGDSILVKEGGVERAGASYSDYDATNGDLTRSPELTGDFVPHASVGPGNPFSPGTRADGFSPGIDDLFCNLTGSLSLSGPSTFAENGGAGVATYTLSRTGSTAAALTVLLGSSDASEAVFQMMSVEIPAGSASIPVPVDAVDDIYVDGTQGIELAAHAVAYVSAFTAVAVTDDGTDTSYILINEVDADTPGTDQAEFIELYDGGSGNTPLDGYVVVLLNGANDQVYEVYDLDGRTTNQAGFFVIGAPGVPNVDLTDLPFSTGFIQNGSPDAVALYVGNAADFFIGSGVAGSPVDAVIYGGTGMEGDTLGPALGLGLDRLSTDGSNTSNSRLPDGGGPLSLAAFGDGIPTPGTSNMSEGGDTPYEIWAGGFPGVGSRLDDDDCDGLTTVMEYALGKSPLVADRDGVPTVMLAGGKPQLTISKGAEGGADPALSYTVEVSTDMTNWSTADTNVITDDAATLTVEYTGAATRAYMRLVVELQ